MRDYLLLATSALALLACRSRATAPAEDAADHALAEFRGAYPEDVKASGVMRDFEIVAAPVELPLVDGKPLKVWARSVYGIDRWRAHNCAAGVPRPHARRSGPHSGSHLVCAIMIDTGAPV